MRGIIKFSWAMLMLVLTTASLYAGKINIVPVPMQLTEGKGVFVIQKGTRILTDETNGTQQIAALLSDKIKSAAGISLGMENYNAAFR